MSKTKLLTAKLELSVDSVAEKVFTSLPAYFPAFGLHRTSISSSSKLKANHPTIINYATKKRKAFKRKGKKRPIGLACYS
jgi:hypothetical protein